MHWVVTELVSLPWKNTKWHDRFYSTLKHNQEDKIERCPQYNNLIQLYASTGDKIN